MVFKLPKYIPPEKEFELVELNCDTPIFRHKASKEEVGDVNY